MSSLRSMTGFAAAAGEIAGARWRWEARSVNGRGLELRFRLADGAERLEPELRARAAKRLARGNIQIFLKVEEVVTSAGPRIDPVALTAALQAAGAVAAAAGAAGVELRAPSAAEIMAMRGVMEVGRSEPDEAARAERATALLAGFDAMIADLDAARAGEGRALADILSEQVTRIETLCAEAAQAAEVRAEGAAERLRAKVAALTGAGAEIAEDRLAQELALLAVKADVREELDRLAAHVAAARALLAGEGPVGRKLDFLSQEFNREVNTLCSKSGSAELTALGLDLKAAVEQMREQIQNVE